MDVFRFTNPTNLSKMEQGLIINGIKKKTWIERYDEAGEFTFEAPVSSGLRELLPIGSFISHVDTREIMIVENHEINETFGSDSWVTVTGRGYETYLENLIIGANKNFPIADAPDRKYILDADYSWNQIVQMIKYHTDSSYLLNDDYAIPYLTVDAVVSGTGHSEIRSIDKGTIYERLLDLLKVDKLGIKVIRPQNDGTAGNTIFRIHNGIDKSKLVTVSYDSGEIKDSDYLWSNKNHKNAAYVTSKWVEVLVGPINPEITGYNIRLMTIDASDIDNHFDIAPEGANLTTIISLLQRRGLDALSKQNYIVLVKAEVSHQPIKAQYRSDYDVGDTISIYGGYNESAKMRVIEYVEIEDETGASGYPTLVLDDDTIPTSVVHMEDSMLFKTGSVYLIGGNPYGESVRIEITFVTPFVSDNYSIVLSETIVTNSDPIDEIGYGYLTSERKSVNGFTIHRSSDTSAPDHHLRIDWFAFLTENAEGSITETL